MLVYQRVLLYIYYDAKLPVHDIHNSTFLASGVESAQFQQKTDTRCNKSNQLVLHAFQVKHIISTILVSWYNSHPYHNTCEVYLYHWLYIYIHILYLIGIQYILDILHPVYIICELMRFLPRRRLHPESALEKSWEQRNIDRKTWGFAWENIRKPKFWHLHEHSFLGGCHTSIPWKIWVKGMQTYQDSGSWEQGPSSMASQCPIHSRQWLKNKKSLGITNHCVHSTVYRYVRIIFCHLGGNGNMIHSTMVY